MTTSATDTNTVKTSNIHFGLLWRVHLWSAAIATPFVLLATLTGLLYIFTPQIEALLHGDLDHVGAGLVRTSLDEQVAAATVAAGPGLTVRAVIPPLTTTDSTRVYFKPARSAEHEHAGHHMPAETGPASAVRTIVYIDPYSNLALGVQAEADRFSNWSRKLHSALLQGDGWRWLIELAASWMMVLLLTGVYLWWPRGAKAVLPRKGATGRRRWRQWHAFLGVALGLMSLVVLTTGLTWSKYAGERFTVVRDAIGQKPARAPKDLSSIVPLDGALPLGWQATWEQAARHVPSLAMQLAPPDKPTGTWRVTSLQTEAPAQRFELAMDNYSGAVRYASRWPDQNAYSQATAIGVRFHRGEYGWWNQLLLLAFGLVVLFSILSGWVMYFRRRQIGSLGLPKVSAAAWRSLPLATWPVLLLLLWLMPLFALSSLAPLLMETGWWLRGRRGSTAVIA